MPDHTASPRTLTIGLTQWHADRNMARNLELACSLIGHAARQGARLVLLPENGLMLGTNAEMRAAALTLECAEILQLREAAAHHHIAVILGGFKRRDASGTIHNTALAIGADGEIAGSYDKIHLFDARIQGHSFEASSVETRGEQPVIVQVDGIRVGLSICYDLRFPELYRTLALAGAEVLLVPSAFTHTTGKAHWEILLRARAIENAAWVVASATIRCVGSGDAFETWGHALIADPWGEVVTDLAEQAPGCTVLTLDMDRVRDVRAKLPVLQGVQLQACQRTPTVFVLP